MKCFDCHQLGKVSEAIGICHHCSVAVCPDHGTVFTHPLPVAEPAAKAATLPSHYRSLLCPDCFSAIKERPELENDAVTCVRSPRPIYPWA
ncbi:MAG: DUF2180 family protein [Bryobacterales bacterium]|nr:DUF2180 family protein [Bryobacterales bacterium]